MPRRTFVGSAILKPPYPFQLVGRCAGCGADPVTLTRSYGPDVFRYRCVGCLPSEPGVPPRAAVTADRYITARTARRKGGLS